MKWFSYLLVFLLAVVVSVLLAPLLPLFAVMSYGACGNGSYSAVEPRLPRWLRWFDNPDNSLWGDLGWQKSHCPNYYGCYLGMVLWLWRNKAGRVKYDLLAVVPPEPVQYTGTVGIDSEPYQSGKLVCRSGPYWQWKWVSKPIGSRCLLLSFGWLLDMFIPAPGVSPPTKAKFLCQIQFSTRKRPVYGE